MTDAVKKPWGEYRVLTENEYSGKVVKLLTVFPGHMLSLQSHKHRTECWHPLAAGLIKYVHDGDWQSSHKAEVMFPEKTYRVSAGTKHRLINPTDKIISVIEVITGLYDEEDIVRYHDTYGRI